MILYLDRSTSADQKPFNLSVDSRDPFVAMGIYYSCYHPTKFSEPAYRSEDPALELVDGRQSGDFDVVG